MAKVKKFGNDIEAFLVDMSNRIASGSVAAIGYLNDHKFSLGPKTRNKYVAGADAELAQYIETLEDGAFKNSLISWRNSAKYQKNISGKSATAPMELDGVCNIICVTTILFDWKDSKDFASYYGDRNDRRLAVRSKYGFNAIADADVNAGEDGRLGVTGFRDENDWRRKYDGGSQYGTARGAVTNKYINPHDNEWVKNAGFYRKHDDYDEQGHGIGTAHWSVRQVPSQNKFSDRRQWFFVDANGQMFPINREFMAWFQKTYAPSTSQPKLIKIMDDMCQEEKDFCNELNALEIELGKTSETTLPIENIVFISGTDTEGEQILWRNDDILVANNPYVTKANIDDIITTGLEDAGMTIDRINEARGIRYNRSRRLNESRGMVVRRPSRRRAINESRIATENSIESIVRRAVHDAMNKRR